MNEGQPARPANMENIVAINQGRQQEPMLTPQAPSLAAPAAQQRMDEGYLILDTRHESAFGAGHIPGAFNIQLESGEFEQRVGWIMPLQQPLILVAADEDAAREALYKLAFVGLDRRVAAVLEQGMDGWMEAGLAMSSVPQISADDLRQRMAEDTTQVLDVRSDAEWASGHIPGARHIFYRDLQQALPADLDPQAPLAVLCSGGQRSNIAASILLRHGFEKVHNVTGGMGAYEATVSAG
jgi:hydroxyacylglutathione hydrolase